MILSLNDCALAVFIRDLPDEMSAKIEARNPVTLQEAFEYAIQYEARHQTDRLFFQHFSRYEQPRYRDSEERIFSPEGRSTPSGLNYNHRQSNHSPDYRLVYQHEWKLQCTRQIEPEISTKMNGRQISVITLGQREELYVSKSTDLINAFTEHDNAKECKTTRSENTLKTDLISDSEVFPISIMRNLLGKSGKLNKRRVKTEVTKKEDLIREEKVIKECRKRKRSISDPQSEAPLAVKIVKASTLINTNIPRTSFTGSEKTAKVTEESQDTLTDRKSVV